MNKMQLIFILSWIFLIFIIFLISSNSFHPIIMMIFLIFYSILINFNMSIWKSNFIYSIMLFLIMISGMLIIFLYFASLVSNELSKFSFNLNFLYFFFMNLLIFWFFQPNMFKIYSNNSSYNMEYSEINPLNKILKKINFNIIHIYEYPFNNLTIFCMFFLLISLFSIIKICSIKSISLRKIN